MNEVTAANWHPAANSDSFLTIDMFLKTAVACRSPILPTPPYTLIANLQPTARASSMYRDTKSIGFAKWKLSAANQFVL